MINMLILSPLSAEMVPDAVMKINLSYIFRAYVDHAYLYVIEFDSEY